MDLTTIFGVLIGLAGIVLGNLLEGGHMSSILQGTAAFIVFGGTAGAVLVAHSWGNIRLAMRMGRQAFVKQDLDYPRRVIRQIMELATLAKNDTLLGLEAQLPRVRDEFARDLLRKVVDGTDPALLREIADHEMEQEERQLLGAAKVWADAGGFSPTIGIIGAVLGLIHVMGNLTDTSKLGAGIAVAFVATIYGVASANLIFIPLSNKIKLIIKTRIVLKEMILEGALGIASGLNPRILEQKLESFYKEMK